MAPFIDGGTHSFHKWTQELKMQAGGIKKIVLVCPSPHVQFSSSCLPITRTAQACGVELLPLAIFVCLAHWVEVEDLLKHFLIVCSFYAESPAM